MTEPDLQVRQFGRTLREFLSAHVHRPPPLLLSPYCFCQIIDRDPMSRLAKLKASSSSRRQAGLRKWETIHVIKNWSIRAACAMLLAAAMTSVAPQIATAAVQAEQSLTATGETDDVVQPATEDPHLHNPWG